MKKVFLIAICATLVMGACKKQEPAPNNKVNQSSTALLSACPGCTWKGYMRDDGVFDCKSGGNDCRHTKKADFTAAQMQQLQIFDSYFGSANQNPCDYFNNYDWTILFDCLSQDFVTQIQDHGVSWCKNSNATGDVLYEAIPTTESCGTTNVLFTFQVTQQ